MKTIFSPTMINVILLVLIIFSFESCKKLDVPKDTPRCIKKKIREFRKEYPNCNSKVYQYEYKGETVYLFNPGSSGCGNDLASTVYDEECNYICSPFGGISGGGGDGKCLDFSNTRTNEKLIWEDEK